MAVALALREEGVTDRNLYLFDTFEGMPAPDALDIDAWGSPALETFAKMKKSAVSSSWAYAPLDAVVDALGQTGYPMDKIHFVKGLVEETVPAQAPGSIALLRLDTDWYKSTSHEMRYLYPRLSVNGIAIIDDYGHYSGARAAVDEYFAKSAYAPFLHRIDYTGRLIIKCENGELTLQ